MSLSPIFTHYINPLSTLPPLDNDENVIGKPADHLIVLMKPLSNQFPSQDKRYKVIKYRPFPDSAIRSMGQWIQSQSWEEIYRIKCPNIKAQRFEEIIMEKVNFFFPEKSIKLNQNDKPWVDGKLLKLDRARKREYNNNKKSEKWLKLNEEFLERSK